MGRTTVFLLHRTLVVRGECPGDPIFSRGDALARAASRRPPSAPTARGGAIPGRSAAWARAPASASTAGAVAAGSPATRVRPGNGRPRGSSPATGDSAAATSVVERLKVSISAPPSTVLTVNHRCRLPVCGTGVCGCRRRRSTCSSGWSRRLTPAPAVRIWWRPNLGVEKLRFLCRLAKDLRHLDTKRCTYAARALDETGRLIGGWRKAHDAAQP